MTRIIDAPFIGGGADKETWAIYEVRGAPPQFVYRVVCEKGPEGAVGGVAASLEEARGLVPEHCRVQIVAARHDGLDLIERWQSP